MDLAIMGAAILIFLLSQSALAFVKGDKVRLTMNPRLGPYTVESCHLDDSQKICKLKDAGYSVSFDYLQKAEASVKLAKETAATNEASAVRVQFSGR